MPIKGLSEIVRLPRLGKVRLGIRQEGDRGPYPAATDHFVCPEAVQKVFGEKPKELRVMFPTEDESQWAAQYLKCYSASRGLICRGDGEMAIARVDAATGEIATKDAAHTELRPIGLREVPCDPEGCPRYRKAQCRRVMCLQFLLPDCPGFGVYQLTTSSFFSIVNVNSAIKAIRGICGRISMLPLFLKLVDRAVQPEGRQKTVRVLQLTAPYTPAEMQKYAQTPPSRVLLPPPADTEAPDDLFPQEVLEDAEGVGEIPSLDEARFQIWETVRSRMRDLEVTGGQVARWFRKHYQVEAAREDFASASPPEKFTAAMLSRFGEALALYEAGHYGGR